MPHPHVIHLAFQDFRQPGSGGGAIRTHEINRRLSSQFDITAYTTKYRGARPRIEVGVHYVPIGLAWGYFGSILSYFLAVPWVLWRHQADLVVEDFAAPFSSCLAPLWTRSPTLAMVQWLNAKDKSKQYHLPFFMFENLGLALHRQYIVVSDALKSQILRRRPTADITVIANGLPASAFETALNLPRQGIVYLGRLERAQKGLDLLIEIMKKPQIPAATKLTIIGDGPDEEWLRHIIAREGLGDRIILAGRLEGDSKYQALAQAAVVVIPSRFETFGIVAIEALACGTSVVATDLPALREVIPSRLGQLIQMGDSDGFAQALAYELNVSINHQATQAVKRREFAHAYNWDSLAAAQGREYQRLIDRGNKNDTEK